eukprot:GHUV01033738.1.p1 GENE.GHUV01033738.1~~GHUV01033738.1.p1  ORF type:complete len:102 (-),score=10.72 GHUV01033738.1:739-1044(-)
MLQNAELMMRSTSPFFTPFQCSALAMCAKTAAVSQPFSRILSSIHSSMQLAPSIVVEHCAVVADMHRAVHTVTVCTVTVTRDKLPDPHNPKTYHHHLTESC